MEHKQFSLRGLIKHSDSDSELIKENKHFETRKPDVQKC